MPECSHQPWMSCTFSLLSLLWLHYKLKNIIFQPALTWNASLQHVIRALEVNWMSACIDCGWEIVLDFLAGMSFVNHFRWTGMWFKMWWIVARLFTVATSPCFFTCLQFQSRWNRLKNSDRNRVKGWRVMQQRWMLLQVMFDCTFIWSVSHVSTVNIFSFGHRSEIWCSPSVWGSAGPESSWHSVHALLGLWV